VIEMLAVDSAHPSVAYLISSYNHLPYIKRSIDSVLGQRYPNVEILVCDDCSTDGSREFLEQYSRDTQITVLFNDRNRGAAHGLNKMIARSDAEYIGFLASDDWIEPEKTAAQVRFMTEHGVDAVLAPVRVFDEKSGASDIPDMSDVRRQIEEGTYLERLYRTDSGGAMTQSGLFHRAAVAAIGGFLENYGSDDWLLCIRFLQAGYTVGFLEEAHTVYRLHATNTHRDALYCLHRLQLPVISDFVPPEHRRTALASAYHSCAMKLLETDAIRSAAYEARALHARFDLDAAAAYAKAAVLGTPGMRRLYFRAVKPLRDRRRALTGREP